MEKRGYFTKTRGSWFRLYSVRLKLLNARWWYDNFHERSMSSKPIFGPVWLVSAFVICLIEIASSAPEDETKSSYSTAFSRFATPRIIQQHRKTTLLQQRIHTSLSNIYAGSFMEIWWSSLSTKFVCSPLSTLDKRAPQSITNHLLAIAMNHD